MKRIPAKRLQWRESAGNASKKADSQQRSPSSSSTHHMRRGNILLRMDLDSVLSTWSERLWLLLLKMIESDALFLIVGEVHFKIRLTDLSLLLLDTNLA